MVMTKEEIILIFENGETMTNSEHNMSATSDPINKENQSIQRTSPTIKKGKD